jgi:hypothetical protein
MYKVILFEILHKSCILSFDQIERVITYLVSNYPNYMIAIEYCKNVYIKVCKK